MHILVSNLTGTVVNDDLVQLFALYGEVSFSVVVRDRITGQSKGRAFIEMPYEAQGREAVAALHGRWLNGQAIAVVKITGAAGETTGLQA